MPSLHTLGFGPRGPVAQNSPSVDQTPFSQKDWPTIPPRRQSGEIFVAVNLLLTVLAAPAVVPRAPLYSPRPPIQSQQQWVAPNLLLTTLAAPAAAPFKQVDWPIPIARRSQQQDFAQNLLGTTLAPTGAVPFSQIDWPKQTSRARTQADAPLNLLLTPGLTPPFRPVDLPNPRAITRAFQADPPNLLTSTLSAAPSVVPFSLDDWPSPQARRAPQTDAFQNLLSTTLAPTTALAPFRQPEWQVQRAGRWQDRWLAPNLQTGTLAPPVGAAPFNQDEWPSPRPARTLPPDAFPNLLATTLAPIAASPFVPYDWPIRQRAVFRSAEPSGSPPALLGTPAVVPFRPIDWGGVQARSRQRAEDYSNLLTTALAPAQTMPFGRYDWPNPRRILARLQYESPNLLEGVLAPPAAPPVFDGPLSQTSFGTPRIREITGFRIRIRYGIRVREEK